MGPRQLSCEVTSSAGPGTRSVWIDLAVRVGGAGLVSGCCPRAAGFPHYVARGQVGLPGRGGPAVQP